MTSVEVAAAFAEGVRIVRPDARVDLCPMADGGEGTVEAIAIATHADIRTGRVRGPLLGQEIEAQWAHIPPGSADALAGSMRSDQPVAVIEMAQASGYSLVPQDQRNPMVTSTFGTGELVLQALDAGCRQIVVGIGGSSTVDGGTGLAAALGFRFFDENGLELEGQGSSLRHIARIDGSSRDKRIDSTLFVVASDVDSPLTGPRGAARIFGPQKGATEEQVEELEAGLVNLGGLMGEQLGKDVADLPGAGAAGGLGAGLMAFCGASIRSGVELVAEVTGLAALIRGADLVLTGEGSYDSQTASGKTPAGVVSLAEQEGVPAVVIAGRIEDGSDDTSTPVFCIVPGPVSLEEAMRDARRNAVEGTARLMRLLGAFGCV